MSSSKPIKTTHHHLKNENKEPETAPKKKRRKRARNSAVKDSSENKKEWNPLALAQTEFLGSLSPKLRSNFFDDNEVTPEERAEVWTRQADVGEELINRHAWATPDLRCLSVLKHFSPLIEIGCGSNAYWANWMVRNTSSQIDIVAFDCDPTAGGHLPSNTGESNKSSSKKKNLQHYKQIQVKKGGPEVLAKTSNQTKTLFLCYPDETENTATESSMGLQCLLHFKGTHLIHVGELYGDSTSLDSNQHPWGRSSSPEFQIELNRQFHCILKIYLKNNWLHVHDTLTVWKRTSHICTMVFAPDDSDDQDDDEEEICFKHIPLNERLPLDQAAPCMLHFLNTDTVQSKLAEPSPNMQDFDKVNNQISESFAKDHHNSPDSSGSDDDVTVDGPKW